MRTDIGTEGISRFQPDSTISTRLGISKSDLIDLETANTKEAHLFYVSRGMTDLAGAAAISLPAFALDAQDFPTEQGLIYFDGGIAANWGEHPVTIYAVSWRVL